MRRPKQSKRGRFSSEFGLRQQSNTKRHQAKQAPLTLNKPRQPLSVHKKQNTKQLQCASAQSKQDREELEYVLASDKRPYKASTHSRFDNPECTAIVGSVLRQLLIRKGVSAVFSRQGYEADLKMIAKASSDFCINYNIQPHPLNRNNIQFLLR